MMKGYMAVMKRHLIPKWSVGPPAGYCGFCTWPLVGCGGSSSLELGIQSNIFMDSSVYELSCRTPTLKVTTDSSSTFFNNAGETVTFALGDIVLGSPRASVLTPISIVPAALFQVHRVLRIRR